jgi:hypothetical protein
MKLEEKYPKLFDKFEDKDLELRHLINVDENYEDFDSEEYEYDFEEYNYVIYISELVQEALGKSKLEELLVKVHDKDVVENFLATELDIYGMKTNLNTDELTDLILNQIEEIV